VPPTPDLAGFRDAMNRLRQNFGQDVRFRIPAPKVWPAGTQLDPESGEPFDPAIDPLSGGGFTDVVKHVGVVTKPIVPGREGGDTRFEAGGAFSGMDAILDMAAADKADVEDATEVILYGERFDIIEMKPGGLGGGADVIDRYVVYLEAK
jgi:hypothetical protein